MGAYRLFMAGLRPWGPTDAIPAQADGQRVGNRSQLVDCQTMRVVVGLSVLYRAIVRPVLASLLKQHRFLWTNPWPPSCVRGSSITKSPADFKQTDLQFGSQIQVGQSACFVLDHHEHVQHMDRHSNRGEEVTR